MRYNVKTDGTKRNKRFERLCVIDQHSLKHKLERELKNSGKEVVDGNGFLYAKGDIPILLTAHLDTVHKQLPKEIIYEKGRISSPQGIGGDDRCGVYMVMEIIKEFPCHVIFFEDEEKGGIGSDKFTETELCESLKGKLNYAIDLDRMNSHDAVYYSQDNFTFEKFIESKFWKIAYGSFTDICNICPVLECAGVNLSCGYYKHHTTGEYVVLAEMENAIKEVKKLIARTNEETDKFEYIARKWNSKYSGLFDSGYSYDDYENYGYYSYDYTTKKKKEDFISTSCFEVEFESERGIESEFVDAMTYEEAVGFFLIDHPTMTYNDIKEIYEV